MGRGPEDDWSRSEHIQKHGDENEVIAETQRGWLDAGTAAAASLLLAITAGAVSAVAVGVGFVSKDPVLVTAGLIGLTAGVLGAGVLKKMMDTASKRIGG